MLKECRTHPGRSYRRSRFEKLPSDKGAKMQRKLGEMAKLFVRPRVKRKKDVFSLLLPDHVW